MSNEAPDSEPLWGSLPVEYHIIVRHSHATRGESFALTSVQKNWDHMSTETIAEQRLRIIREYLDADVLEEPPWEDQWNLVRPAIQVEIDTILRPWRSLRLRNAARTQSDNMNVPLLLRTYYNPDAAARAKDDAQLAEWVSDTESELVEQLGSACLDDYDLFNFGNDWERLFEVIPELANPTCGVGNIRPHAPPYDSEIHDLEGYRSTLKDMLRRKKQIGPKEWQANPQHMIEVEAKWLQLACITRNLIIVDQEAFETGHCRLVLFDSRQNIIREARFEIFTEYMGKIMRTGNIAEIKLDYWDVKFRQWIWEDSQVGEKYRANGEVGRVLYQLTEEDWADPEPPVNEMEELSMQPI